MSLIRCVGTVFWNRWRASLHCRPARPASCQDAAACRAGALTKGLDFTLSALVPFSLLFKNQYSTIFILKLLGHPHREPRSLPWFACMSPLCTRFCFSKDQTLGLRWSVSTVTWRLRCAQSKEGASKFKKKITKNSKILNLGHRGSFSTCTGGVESLG